MRLNLVRVAKSNCDLLMCPGLVAVRDTCDLSLLLVDDRKSQRKAFGLVCTHALRVQSGLGSRLNLARGFPPAFLSLFL